MIPDSIAILLLLSLIAAIIYIRQLQVDRVMAYLDGWIDGRRAVAAPESGDKPVPPAKVYDWAKEGL